MIVGVCKEVNTFKNNSISVLLNIASKPSYTSATDNNQITATTGNYRCRDTRHLVWFKSHRQYSTDFPLTLLIAFHMTQYQKH